MIKPKKIIKTLSSLKLGMFSLTGLFIIVLVGTFAQVDLGIFYAQKLIFKPLFITKTFGNITLPIFPGGLFFGVLLVINLSFAMLKHIQWTAQKVGLVLIHLGLIFLLVGGGMTSLISTESQVALKEGESALYAQDLHYVELAVIDRTNAYSDFIVSIPEPQLESKGKISHSSLPFSIEVEAYYSNTFITNTKEPSSPLVTHGIGQSLTLREIPIFVTDDKKNNPAIIITLRDQNNQSLGQYLMALSLVGAQSITVDNHEYYLLIRPRRFYFPFMMTLNDFNHDKYPGSDVPKNFSSDVTLMDYQTGKTHDHRIYMNHPLRYKGFTFYQASFGENDTLSILQVVQNPSWLIPYISCLIISLGLLLQFCAHFYTFIKRRQS